VTAARLLDLLVEAGSPMEALAAFKPPAACAEDWPAFAETLRLIRSNAVGWPTEFDLACRWYLRAVTKTPECAKPILCSSLRAMRAREDRGFLLVRLLDFAFGERSLRICSAEWVGSPHGVFVPASGLPMSATIGKHFRPMHQALLQAQIEPPPAPLSLRQSD
jgi:hypothetical protein